MSDAILSARELHKSYDLGRRKVEVLHGVSLEIASGDFLSLQGASGAGKSTLLHLLGGLDEPSAGEVFAGDQSLFGMGAARLAKWRNCEVGFVFQAYHLLPEFDALENVIIPARMAHTGIGVAERRGRELLERVGLAKRMQHLPTELSGGEQQRVALARALINRPRILFADEPTGNLDSKTGLEILDLLGKLHADGKTIIVVTHDEEVAERADRVIRLMDGLVDCDEFNQRV